jgi:hypothetical protein
MGLGGLDGIASLDQVVGEGARHPQRVQAAVAIEAIEGPARSVLVS